MRADLLHGKRTEPSTGKLKAFDFGQLWESDLLVLVCLHNQALLIYPPHSPSQRAVTCCILMM